MERYLRLYAYFLRFSFSRALEFRLDFYFRIAMDTAFYVVQIAFFMIIYRHTDLLGGWNFDQVLVFTAAFLLADAINMTFFSNNLWWLPILINKGDLDYYLMRPVSSLFFLMFRDFAANSFMNLVIAGGIMVWALMRYPEPLGVYAVSMFFFALLVGNLIWAFVMMMFLIPVFWMHSPHAMRETLFQFGTITGRPDQIFKGWVRRVITSVLPLAMVASWPAHILFEGGSLPRLAHMLLVLTLIWLFILWFWQRGLRAYSSASS